MISDLFRQKSYPLNKIYLFQDKLIDNYKYLSTLSPEIQVAPVVKSNAYGHGIKEIGIILDTQKPPFICVDSLYEAIQLRKAGIKSEILITGFCVGCIRSSLSFIFC
jgi:alanine racemase